MWRDPADLTPAERERQAIERYRQAVEMDRRRRHDTEQDQAQDDTERG